jgi:glucosamine-6-phosphate deaminase
MSTKKSTVQSQVEALTLSASGRKLIYKPTEKVAVIEVDNYPGLGKTVALRFLEWVMNNPGGTVSLPTSKSAEHFIKYVSYYLQNWQTRQVQEELGVFGFDTSQKPDMSSLVFIQSQEYYPINPTQTNSARYFIQKYYFRGFGIDAKKALLMDAWTVGMPDNRIPDDIFKDNIVDLSLRVRHGRNSEERLQKQVIQKVDQYCTDYERRVRELGGIGFLLSDIGPDGHICSNVRGTDHYSTTRLTETNYETQSLAATDLGGIEVAKNRLVMIIGLATMTFDRDCTAIVMAAGESFADVIKNSIQSPPSNEYPASSLQKLRNARFYLTRGAASSLVERRYEDVSQMDPLPDEETDRILIDLALEKNRRLHKLNRSDIFSVRSSKWVMTKIDKKHEEIAEMVRRRLIEKMDIGLAPLEDQVFMHTAPHHDDIMLGYWAYIIHLVRSPRNQNYFNYMTSGFNAVTNSYACDVLENLLNHLDTSKFKELMAERYFEADNEIGRNRDMYQYLDGVAAHSRSMRNEGEARRILRNLISIFEEDNLFQLKSRVKEMILYFQTQYPGKKDLPYIQQLKGMIREWEADLLWGFLGFNCRNVNHLRLGFYGGGLFGDTIDKQRDVEPVLAIMRRIKPTIITLAFDPEGSGPSTHYKVLQTMARAVEIYQQESGNRDIKIWGYRNVWFRFHPSEANIMVPVSLNSMASLEKAFDKCFGSQRAASFPSYELDGPFSRLSEQILVEQYQQVKTCLGREYFNESDHPRMRACHGLVYMKQMSVDEFCSHAGRLRQSTENVSADNNE